MRKSWLEILTSGFILIAIIALLDMLLTNAHAADCIQTTPKKHHKHVPPVACTVAPPLPAILRPVPDELAPIQVYVHYPLIGMCFEEPPTSMPPVDVPVANEPELPDWLIPIGFGGGFIIGGAAPRTASAPTPAQPSQPEVMPPRNVVPFVPPARSTPTVAPELSTDGLAGALTMLAGIVAVLRGRKS